MSLKVCVLASSSAGNCTYVSSGTTSILVDAGLSLRDLERRLALIGAEAARIQAICLSHEHSDHTSGVGLLQRKYGTAVYANAGTAEGAGRVKDCETAGWNLFTTGSAFRIGDLHLEPFAVPHDAFEPVGFVITCGADRLGIATDLGAPTLLVRERLQTCRVIILEANHDEYLLRQSQRPWALKQRILGRHGHLSNEDAAALLADLAGPHLEQVFLAHLSDECNEPALALRTVQDGLTARGHTGIRVCLTHADRPSELWDPAPAAGVAS